MIDEVEEATHALAALKVIGLMDISAYAIKDGGCS